MPIPSCDKKIGAHFNSLSYDLHQAMDSDLSLNTKGDEKKEENSLLGFIHNTHEKILLLYNFFIFLFDMF